VRIEYGAGVQLGYSLLAWQSFALSAGLGPEYQVAVQRTELADRPTQGFNLTARLQLGFAL
jgi:hypothetical protein